MELGYLGWLWRRRSCLFAFKQLSTSCSLYHPNHPLKAKDPISLLFLFILEFASLLLCHYLKRLCCIGLLVVSTMATKIFKYISNIFVVKEREMEIGYPTDVKHVAHIGWDGPSADSAPSWMNEFKNKPDFSTASRVNHQRMDSSNPMAHSAWSSQDFEQSMAHQPAPDLFSDLPPTELPNVSKKPKRKKVKTPSSTARSSRPSKTSKAAYNQMEATQNLLI